MANNGDDSRRNRDRLEDNPFIAFRRFADSQVSSLLNTVFTLPATIANYNNVHQAREACLFKKADKTQCERLQNLEASIADLRHEGRELYRVGDLQEVLKKSEELMKLDRQADDLRREIVAQSKDENDQEYDKDLVHRVANKKGQEWGWDWSWGFPKPFDDEPNSSQETERWREQQLQRLDQFESEARRVFGDEAWTGATQSAFDALDSHPLFRALVGDKAFDEVKDAFEKHSRHREERSKSWRFPPPTDARRLQEAADYSPSALEEDEKMQKSGVDWHEAYNDLISSEQKDNAKTSCPWTRRRMAPGFPKRVPWEGEETSEEPNYEYSHDHEDQHDDPPTPRLGQGRFQPLKEDETEDRHLQEFLSQSNSERQRLLAQVDADEQRTNDTETSQNSTETELDAYEQILAASKSNLTAAHNSSHGTNSTHETYPSVLSTLTTTERTVAPDGSVTTKVVLKKRFADGREESSETLHTQRGQEMPSEHISQWSRMMDQPQITPVNPKQTEQKEQPKRGGWFWSS